MRQKGAHVQQRADAAAAQVYLWGGQQESTGQEKSTCERRRV